MRLKEAPAAVRATGSRARNESHRDKAENPQGRGCSCNSGPGSGPELQDQPSGGTRLLPPGPSEPCAHRLEQIPPPHDSQSSCSSWGRALIDSAADQSDAAGRKRPRRSAGTRSWRPGPG